jgi:hypothetical protein
MLSIYTEGRQVEYQTRCHNSNHWSKKTMIAYRIDGKTNYTCRVY